MIALIVTAKDVVRFLDTTLADLPFVVRNVTTRGMAGAAEVGAIYSAQVVCDQSDAVGSALFLVALAAWLVPALRASRIDPGGSARPE